MDIIYTPVWQNPGNARSPRQFVEDEMWLMEKVEALGFDVCASPEHHFDIDYSACPDNFMPLCYLAAKTTTLKLALGAVILPWNNPLRAAEKLAYLDHLSGGRCMAGFGRGLARMEYEHLGIDMGESRGRFDESIEMVLKALKTGEIEGDGPFYKQIRTPIHPAPRPELADDFLSVGMSPDSAAVSGKIGGRLLGFVTKPIPDMAPVLDAYTTAFREHHPGRRPHVVTDDFYMVRDSADEAMDLAMKYTVNYFHTVVRHYEMDGSHFAEKKGYASYAKEAEALREAGVDAAAEAYVNSQLGVGTPQQILDKLEQRIALIDADLSIAGCFFYGGMSRDEAHISLTKFGEQVIPQAKDMLRAASLVKAA